MAQRELTRVTEISGQTLRFYRKSTKPIETDVSELLESLLHLFHPKFGRRNLQIRTRPAQSDRRILAFPNELRQLFANLISNAIDATPPGGRIRIEVGAGATGVDLSQRGVCVVVADTGSGIPEHVRRRIFEPFVTTKGDAGTGLGLWVCDDIVKRHGGRLRLKTEHTWTLRNGILDLSARGSGSHSAAVRLEPRRRRGLARRGLTSAEASPSAPQRQDKAPQVAAKVAPEHVNYSVCARPLIATSTAARVSLARRAPSTAKQ